MDPELRSLLEQILAAVKRIVHDEAEETQNQGDGPLEGSEGPVAELDAG